MFRSKRRAKTEAAVPEGRRIYAIGDIHGRLDLLDAMLNKIDLDLLKRPTTGHQLIFLGDYIDRGPHGAHVIERLIEVKEQYTSVFIKGNHEEMLLNFVSTPHTLRDWARRGGLTTLMSYGIYPTFKCDIEESERLAKAFGYALPQDHKDFLMSLPTMFVCGDYVFVHAGLRPRRSLQKQTDEDLLWIRDEFLDFSGPFPKFVVHGHTPVGWPEFWPNRINVDIGAFVTGALACLVLEETKRDLIVVRV